MRLLKREYLRFIFSLNSCPKLFNISKIGRNAKKILSRTNYEKLQSGPKSANYLLRIPKNFQIEKKSLRNFISDNRKNRIQRAFDNTENRRDLEEFWPADYVQIVITDEQRILTIMDTATKEYTSILSKHLDGVEARLNINYEALRSSQTRLYERCSHAEEDHWARMVSFVIEKLVQTVRNKSQTTHDALSRLNSLVEKQNEKLLQVERHYIKMEEEDAAVQGHHHSHGEEVVKAIKETIKLDDDDEDKLVDTSDYSYSD